ncbi:MAG: membrane protein insertase YidC [Bdellovibrionales bacterium]|jgi:YidC/Oxa1 family membrane protein insertase
MDNNNFIAAVVLSIAILVGFHYLYEKPQLEKAQHIALLQKEAANVKPEATPLDTLTPKDRAVILAETPRVKIETPELRGSINLKGARIDDLALVKYRETVAKDSPQITLLSPAGSAAPYSAYFASFGWLADAGVLVPDDQTEWKADRKTLEVGKPVLMSWDNGKGLTFERQIAIDDHFLFTVMDRVKNTSDGTVTLYPFGLVARHGHPQVEGTYVLHEGPVGVLGGTLQEIKYKKLLEEPKITMESQGGWLGITDKYWLVTLLPAQDEKITATFSFALAGNPAVPDLGTYQTDFRGTPISLAAGASTERTSRLFAGAKRVSLLDQYEKQLGLPLFDRAIDFGWYYYLTKPFLYLLDSMNTLFGNMGIAIFLFTIMLKTVTLPLSLKSSRSMAKMKTLQPEMKALQERYKDDKQKLSVATMELYQREKVNPMSGCVPILIQIPIFFALYKVLYVGIEMRHAPLFGWVHDMSAPDPTSVLTFFGYLNWSFIPHLGVWPILMGISMFAQQKLSPAPTDKTQANMFLLMPLLFTFMMGNVAAGLIFYWTISNILGIGQQWYVNNKVVGRR